MKRGVKIVRAADRKDESLESVGGKISVSEILAKFDDLWRIEHSEDLARLRAKEQKARELRAAIASLVEN
jgi:hypothetical protein